MVYIQTCHQGLISTNFICCCQVQHGDAKGVVEPVQNAIKIVPWGPELIWHFCQLNEFS